MKKLTLEDFDEMERIIFDTSVFPYVHDDGISKDSLDLSYFFETRDVYVLQGDENSIFIYIPINAITWEVHTNILPGSRGKKALKLFMEAAKYMFENTDCQKIITHIPEFNYRARASAHKIMKQEGYITECFLKKGKLYDLYLYALNKREVLTCQQ